MAARTNDITAGLDLLKKSKVVNQNTTLRELMDLSYQLEQAEGFGDAKVAYSWVFISRHFIYKGNQPTKKAPK